MNSRSYVPAAAAMLLGALNATVGAQTPTGPDMGAMMQMQVAEPAPPQPGDAAMTCEQIAREFQGILRKKNVQANAAANTQAACEMRQAMTLTPAQQAALSANMPEAEALRQQKSAQMQQANQQLMAANAPMMQAMNDPRLMRLAILADEKHCAIQNEEPPAQAPVADPCGPGVVTPAMVTGGVVPPAPASGASSGRTDPFKATTPAVAPPPAAGTSDPFVKQGSKTPPPAEKQPTTDPFKKN
jgi:hypothetical protein